jgi:hypothetical protein
MFRWNKGFTRDLRQPTECRSCPDNRPEGDTSGRFALGTSQSLHVAYESKASRVRLEIRFKPSCVSFPNPILSRTSLCLLAFQLPDFTTIPRLPHAVSIDDSRLRGCFITPGVGHGFGPPAAKAACNRFWLDAGQLSLRGGCCADTRAG